MRDFLAVLAVVLLLLIFRIPQRINWDELRGFKGSEQVEATLQGINEQINTPSSNSTQSDNNDLKPEIKDKKAPKPVDEAWMRQGCNPSTIKQYNRINKEIYRRHYAARDLGATSPLEQIEPYCLDKDGNRVYIPDWLTNRGYRLKITKDGQDVIEKPLSEIFR